MGSSVGISAGSWTLVASPEGALWSEKCQPWSSNDFLKFSDENYSLTNIHEYPLKMPWSPDPVLGFVQ